MLLEKREVLKKLKISLEHAFSLFKKLLVSKFRVVYLMMFKFKHLKFSQIKNSPKARSNVFCKKLKLRFLITDFALESEEGWMIKIANYSEIGWLTLTSTSRKSMPVSGSVMQRSISCA